VYNNFASSPYWANTLWQPHETLQDRPTTFNDGEMLIAITGHGELVAVDIKTGTVLYHGPIGIEPQWNALPAVVRDKLASWRRVIRPSAATQAAGEKAEPRTK
jgi:outer membrane protein assembly factor BamB